MTFRMAPHNAVTALFGLCCIAAGIYIHYYMGRFLETAREATGVVVELVYETATMQKGRMHPVVKFRTSDGREVTGRSDKHYNTQPGATLQIVYDAAHPERIEIGTLARVRNQRIFFSGVTVLFGLALGLGAIAVDRGLLRRKPGVARNE